MTQTTLITGASSGIGLELAKVFARNHYNLILVARSEDKLYDLQRELSQQHNIEVVVCAYDLTDKAAPTQLYAQLQQQNLTVDVLVNNAGYGDYGDFICSDWEKIQGMILLNILALTHLTRLFLPAMCDRGSGKVLNVSSTAAFQPGPMMAVYFATKAYVLSFSEAIAAETEAQGITVTTLCPGPTQSSFISTANMDKMALASSVSADKIPTAAEVAQFGYDALSKGKVVAVYGLANQLLTFSTRLMPRGLLRKSVKQFLAAE
ncbi:MAG: SDR family oxidoreductase [Phormidesmis sp. RL_2_1]|nr:SDR family oxidoreductase [Phormidesmis sp. RL_2_1]